MRRNDAEVVKLSDAIITHLTVTDLNRNTPIDADFTEQMWDLIESDYRAGWNLIVALLNRTDPGDHDALAYIGAGPLQHLVAHHSNRVIGELEDYAAREPIMREALNNVILDPTTSEPGVVDRLTTIAPGIRLFRFPKQG